MYLREKNCICNSVFVLIADLPRLIPELPSLVKKIWTEKKALRIATSNNIPMTNRADAHHDVMPTPSGADTQISPAERSANEQVVWGEGSKPSVPSLW